MRLRVKELLREHGMTAYGLHKRSKGKIGMNTAYRLASGKVETLSLALLEELCRVFELEDPGALFVPEKRSPRR
jgi:DNA-binding Xre family transcriptional regulator